MNIGMSTASYFHILPLEDTIGEIAGHGIDIIEVFLNTFSEYEEGFVNLLGEKIRSNHLSVYSIHPMSTQFEPQLFSMHPRQRADALELYHKVLRGGKALGAGYYVMHGPVFLQTAPKNMNFERYVPIFDELSAIARSYGLQLTLENVSWCVFRHPEFGRALRGRLGGRVQFTLDIKQALRSGFSPFEFLDAVGPDLANVHLCDARTGPDGRLRLEMPGEGTFDFLLLKRRLAELGYAGPGFIEVYSDMYGDMDALYRSYEAMRRVYMDVQGG